LTTYGFCDLFSPGALLCGSSFAAITLSRVTRSHSLMLAVDASCRTFDHPHLHLATPPNRRLGTRNWRRIATLALPF